MTDLYIRTSVDEIRWPGLPVPKGAITLSLLFQLERTQWWRPEEILQWQLYQLGALLAEAYRAIPFYRERLDQVGLKPDGKSVRLEDWVQLPLLQRGEIQAAGDRLVNADLPESHGWTEEIFTSGSTGKPVRVVRTELSNRVWSAFTIRDHLWHRRDMRCKLAALRDSGEGEDPYPDGSTAPYWGSSTGRVFASGPSVGLNVNCTVEQQIDWLQRQNPEYLLTHPTLVDRLANYAIEHDIKLPNLRQVETISEILRPATRAACRAAWGVPVVDMYTTRDVGYIALQCPDHEHYHVQSEGVFLEVLDDDGLPCGPGEVGRVVVTQLHNLAMPLIRYEIGDYAEVGAPCACGRGLQVLNRILGRKQNMLVLPSGEERWPLLSSDNIAALLALAPIEQYQIVQRTLGQIELRLVVAQPLSADQRAKLKGWVQAKLGHPFDVEITCLDEIPRTKAGKLLDFVCEVER